MPHHLFFYVALAFILTHEMDAVKRQEWRIFPLLSLLKEETAYAVFTLLHVPLYLLLFWGLADPLRQEGVITGLDWFFMIHIGLHLLLINHRNNQFKTLLSWALIVLTGLFGLLDILLTNGF